VAGSQESLVQEFPSLQSRAACAHPPVPESQLSVVHALSSLQSGCVPRQMGGPPGVPATHASSVVQALWSSQGLPRVEASPTQLPVKSQKSAEVQESPSSQLAPEARGVPAQTIVPFNVRQESAPVQEFPSSQSVPTGTGEWVQLPYGGWLGKGE